MLLNEWYRRAACALALAVNLIFTAELNAKDKVSHGFERLAIHDYFAARQSFHDAIKKQPVAAYYGLSIISSLNNNPFFNLDSARIFILKADTLFRYLTSDEELKLRSKYKIGPGEIRARKDSISWLAFSVAKKQNQAAGWDAFISDFHWSVLSDSAILLRNELAFSAAKKENTSKSYHDFFTRYPSGIQAGEAKKRYEHCLFLEQTAAGTEQSFSLFIANYPDSPYRLQAEDSLFQVATKKKSPEAYYSFAKKYPLNKNAPAAWMKMYNRYLEINGADNLADFFNRYPDFKYRKQVEEDFRLSNVALLPVRKNNNFTFITEEGKQLIPNLYDDVDEFSEGLCAVNRSGKYGYISKSGKLVIDFLFDEADPFENGFALVKVNGKATVINRDGEMLVPLKYPEVGAPHDDRILFLDSVMYGYMDTRGRIVIPPRYEEAQDFSGGMAVAGREEELGIIDINGQWTLPAQYASVRAGENGVIRVEKAGQFGLLNRLGDEVVPIEYDAIGKFSSGLALAAKDEKFGYVDPTGRMVIPLLYDFDRQTMDRSEFRNGYAEVKEKGKSVLIDSTGNKILPALYDDINFYSPILPIAARKKTKWGFIDMENKTLIAFKYDQVSSFSEGLAVVKNANSFGVIRASGEIVIPFNYDFISLFRNSVAVVKQETGFGLISSAATLLVECGFEKYQWVSGSVIRFDRSGRYGYYNAQLKDWIWKEDGL